MHHLISISDGVARNPQVRLKEPVNLTFTTGEHLAIVGRNGSGKSILVDTLLGKYPLREGKLTYNFSPSDSDTIYKNVKYITFRDSYGEYDSSYYYQQRFNSHEQEDIPLVRDLLGNPEESLLKKEIFDLFQIEPLLDKKIILLSSGELRKFQLAKALLSSPRILIMDNPFIGLDIATRKQLYLLLEELSKREFLQIVLVLSLLEDIPEFITHIIPVDNLKVGEKVTRKKYISSFIIEDEEDILKEKDSLIASLSDNNGKEWIGEEIAELKKVSIQYGARSILKELDWKIERGDRWALSGVNGSGKSTLLSLLYADNPQSYACNISLFGRRRGTGESIWDIKKYIGYVSPEMHRAYLKNISSIEIVGSGLHDSIGLYKTLPVNQREICQWWMKVFGVEHLENKPFLKLSSGEQRLCLLARAFVKDPALLILDEPLHGLDTYNRRMVKTIINAYCKRPYKTLIMVTHYEEELPDSINKRLVLSKNN